MINPIMEYQVIVKGHTEEDVLNPAVEQVIKTILSGVQSLASAIGGKEAFQTRWMGVNIQLSEIPKGGYGKAHSVTLNQGGFDVWTVVHELAHALDGAHGWTYSQQMRHCMHAGYKNCWIWLMHILRPGEKQYWFDPGVGPPPCGEDGNFNEKEDFAEAITAHVFPDEAKQRAASRGWPYNDPARGYSFENFHDTPRGKFIQELISIGG
jgi:hypothetical protein